MHIQKYSHTHIGYVLVKADQVLTCRVFMNLNLQISELDSIRVPLRQSSTRGPRMDVASTQASTNKVQSPEIAHGVRIPDSFSFSDCALSSLGFGFLVEACYTFRQGLELEVREACL